MQECVLNTLALAILALDEVKGNGTGAGDYSLRSLFNCVTLKDI
jgi:hypothetical protein